MDTSPSLQNQEPITVDPPIELTESSSEYFVYPDSSGTQTYFSSLNIDQQCSDLKADLLRIGGLSHHFPHPSVDDPVTQIRLVIEQGRLLCELYNMLSHYDFHDPICLQIFNTLSPRHAARRSISRFRARLKMMHEVGVIEEHAIIDESAVLNPVSAHAFQRVLNTMAIIIKMLPSSVFAQPNFTDVPEPSAASDGDHMNGIQAKLAEYEPRDANRRETIQREPNESTREKRQAMEHLKECIIDWQAPAQMNLTVEDRELRQHKYMERNEQAMLRLWELVVDWKGYSMSTFGELLLEDIFMMTRLQARGRVHVYLFERVLLCCRISDTGYSAQIKGLIRTNIIQQATAAPQELSLSRQHPLAIWWQDKSEPDCLTLWCTSVEQRSLWGATVDRLAEIVAGGARSEVHNPQSDQGALSWFPPESSGIQIVNSLVPPSRGVSLFPPAPAPPSPALNAGMSLPKKAMIYLSDSLSTKSQEKRLPRRVQPTTDRA